MARLTSIISLKDNYSAVMQRVEKNTRSFNKSVDIMKKQLDAEEKKKRQIRMDNTPAMKAIKDLEKRTKAIRNASVMVVAHTQRFFHQFDPVVSKVRWLTKTSWTVTVKVKDLATAGITRLTSATRALAQPLIIGGAAAAAAGTATIGASLKGASNLEQQTISMTHFIGAFNENRSNDWIAKEAAAYLTALRKNADATPFETGEVIAAGTRAIGIASGNTKDAMRLLKLSEDMTALTPGKTLSDAMEALADAQMGEMERLKEFSFKGSKKAFDAAGGDLFKMVSTNGKTLDDMFAGGSEKLSKSAAGIWGKITGTFKTGITNMGRKSLEYLKPELDKLATFLQGGGADSLFEAGSDLMLGLFQSVKKGIDKSYTYVNDRFLNNPEFQNLPDFESKVKFIFNDIMEDFNGWYETTGRSKIDAVAAELGGYLGTALGNMTEPVADAALKFGGEIASGIWEGLQKVIAENPLLSSIFGIGASAAAGAKIGGVYGAAVGAGIGAGVVGGSVLNGAIENNEQKKKEEAKKSAEAYNKLKNWDYKTQGDYLGNNSKMGYFQEGPIEKTSKNGYFSPSQFNSYILNESTRQLFSPRAMGQRTIPRDNFPILAHQGETLLTAQESESGSRKGEVTVHVHNPVVRRDSDFDTLIHRFKLALEEAGINAV